MKKELMDFIMEVIDYLPKDLKSKECGKAGNDEGSEENIGQKHTSNGNSEREKEEEKDLIQFDCEYRGIGIFDGMTFRERQPNAKVNNYKILTCFFVPYSR